MERNIWTMSVIVLALLTSIISCSRDEDLPTLKTCKNLKVSDIGKKNIEIKGDLIFDNPNDRTYAYRRSIVEFNINGKDVGSTIDRKKLEVLSSQDLKLPFKHSFPLERLQVDTTNAEQLKVRITGELELIDAEQKRREIKFKYDTEIKVKNSLEEKRERLRKRKIKQKANEN